MDAGERLYTAEEVGEFQTSEAELVSAPLRRDVDRLTEALEAAERSKVALVEKVKRLEDMIARTRLDGTDRQKAMIGYADRAERAEADHRDLVSRLGFGNNITEPMADNDTIVKWFEEQSRDANE